LNRESSLPTVHRSPFAVHGTRTPRSVLVIATRRIGDVLLATPLMRSVKAAWPEAALDVLVFEGTEGIVAGNGDVRRVLTVPARPRPLQHLAFILRLLRRYDVALSTQRGDRGTLYAFFAGRWRAGLLNATRKERWKRLLLHRWVPFDDRNTHTVRMNLALAGILGIEPRPEVAVSWGPDDAGNVEALLGSGAAGPIAVLHTFPNFNYKMWHRAGWSELARWLSGRGYRIVLTGGSHPGEIAYVADLARDMPPEVTNAAGRLSLAASACLVSRARVYVGPDTALTHVAAALGIPTVALYGPTNPVKWGPWPARHAADGNPWRRCGSQRAGNVFLLQGAGACVPCHLEGCDRHVESFSDCLMELPATRVIAALRDIAGIGEG
jgi:heptosyltransferase-3